MTQNTVYVLDADSLANLTHALCVVSVFSIAVNEQLQVRATRDDIAHAVAKLRAISVEAEKSILALSTLFENLSKD